MFDGPEPIYVQIADHLRAQVLSGELREEEQVMSTTQFATTFRINPATAAKAFSGLVDEGVLYKRRGVGMFVAPGAHARLLADHRAAYVAQVLDPALDRAEMLGIPMETVLDHVRRRAAAAGSPAGPSSPDRTTDTDEVTP